MCVFVMCGSVMFSVCPAGDVSGAGGDGLEDNSVMDENVESSPTPTNRRTRREACTCPYCKDGEGRYASC